MAGTASPGDGEVPHVPTLVRPVQSPRPPGQLPVAQLAHHADLYACAHPPVPAFCSPPRPIALKRREGQTAKWSYLRYEVSLPSDAENTMTLRILAQAGIASLRPCVFAGRAWSARLARSARCQGAQPTLQGPICTPHSPSD